jgi:hypothetical protein
MKSIDVGRYLRRNCLALAMLAGCGGSQPPIGAAGAMPQSRAIATHAERGGSRVLPEAKSEDLIYVLAPRKDYILSHSTGAVKATFTGPPLGGFALCSDNSGDVFIPGNEEIWEYKHGGTIPIKKLKDSGYRGVGCSVDPTTGNLAVVNEEASTGSAAGNVAIFSKATGKPEFLEDDIITTYLSCGYDNVGNLFLDGSSHSAPFLLAELPAASSSFANLTFNEPVKDGGAVQWDGQNLAIGANGARLIYRVTVTGSTATLVGQTRLDTLKNANLTFWVQGGNVLTASGATHKKVGLWPYPRGGKPVKQYGPISHGSGRLGGMTVSVAPSR